MSDETKAAVKAARKGDPDAWDTLFRRHQAPLYVFVMEMVRNRATALDVVQETFIAATRHLRGLRDDGKFASWLFSIARQKTIQHWRKNRHETVPIEESTEADRVTDEDPSQHAVREEDEAGFIAAIGRLSEPQREVLVLHYLDEFVVEEIAVITDTPVGTVKSRLHHARRSLKQILRYENAPGNPLGTTR